MNTGNLIVSSPEEIRELSVVNILGQNIRTRIVNANAATMDLSVLSSGNYIVIAKMSNGQISTQKFSKF
jgi:hypothetical protein